MTLTLTYSRHIRGSELEILASHISKHSSSTLENRKLHVSENTRFYYKQVRKHKVLLLAGAWQWHCKYPALACEQANEMALTRELMNGASFLASRSLKTAYIKYSTFK